MSNFPFYPQHDMMDCGSTCLRMIAKHYGKTLSIDKLRQKSNIGKLGVSMGGIAEGAEALGFRTLGVKTDFEKLAEDAPTPFIAHWNQSHFVVAYAVKSKIVKGKKSFEVSIADPAHGLLTYTEAEFKKAWVSTANQGREEGLALLLEPTPQFYEEEEDEQSKGIGSARLFRYLWAYKSLIVQLCVSLLAASVLQLIFPFLTQSVIDIGVHTHNLSYVSLVLVAQLMLTGGRVLVEFIRSWLLLYISSRINLSLLSDFFIKLMRLPLAFFDVKLFGDLMQRISDHSRIERFLTGTSLNVIFSVFNLFIFGAILAFYHLQIFFIFALGSVLYAFWVVIFLKYRRKLDYKQFTLNAQTQSNVVQLIQGMQEIKLANAERQKRWEWERLQARNFKLDMKSLALGQYQQAGAVAINEGKNIFITFLAAQAVINGQLTLGAMMAMQYIIGQLNAPIQELIQFMQNLQDAQISLERINEIHEQEEEDVGNSHLPLTPNVHCASKGGKTAFSVFSPPREGGGATVATGRSSLHLQNVSFQYAGS